MNVLEGNKTPTKPTALEVVFGDYSSKTMRVRVVGETTDRNTVVHPQKQGCTKDIAEGCERVLE